VSRNSDDYGRVNDTQCEHQQITEAAIWRVSLPGVAPRDGITLPSVEQSLQDLLGRALALPKLQPALGELLLVYGEICNGAAKLLAQCTDGRILF